MSGQFEQIIPIIMIVVFAVPFLMAFAFRGRNAARKEEKQNVSETPVRKSKKARKTQTQKAPPALLAETSRQEEIQPDLKRGVRNYEKFPENLSRFPLLQRAFVLQELFGEPKSLKDG